MDVMNKLGTEKRTAIVRALCEGNSVRATARLTASAKATVLKLLVEIGEFCSIYQDHGLRNLTTTRVEADELWAFVGAKAKNATKEGQGDIWTYTARDADSKLMISWLVGSRNSVNTKAFMANVAERLANRVQLTTDGLGWYVCTGAIKTPIMGNPDRALVSTSDVERSNLTIRMGTRRFTRLTNGFSKKAENHAHAVSLFFMFYNYCKPHMTLTKENGGIKTTPAMAAGLTDRVWGVEDILARMSDDSLLQ